MDFDMTNSANNSSTNDIHGDHNSINNSINITYNIIVNINQRENLKDKQDGKTYEFTMFYINEVNYLKQKGYKFAICTNLCYNYEFMSDHVHVRFRDNMICDYFNLKLITVKGKVYKYKRKDGTYDYAINVEEIIDVSDRICHSNFKIYDKVIDSDSFDEIFDNCQKEMLCDMVQNQLSLLDISLAVNGQIRPGFVTGIILTRYFLNTQLRSLVNQQSVLRKARKECLIDIYKLTSYIIYSIDKGEIYKWDKLLSELNLICNYLQGVFINNKERTESDREKIYDNLKSFGEIVGSVDVKQLQNMNRVYNKNYGFRYPDNKDQFEEELRCRVLRYMLTKGYIKIR